MGKRELSLLCLKVGNAPLVSGMDPMGAGGHSPSQMAKFAIANYCVKKLSHDKDNKVNKMALDPSLPGIHAVHVLVNT